MIRQQVIALADDLIEGGRHVWELLPALPPNPDNPCGYEGFLVFNKLEGQFELDLTIWTGYYHFPATREQPADEGWADEESIWVRSPFLSDILGELETQGITFACPPQGEFAPCLP